MLLQLQIFCCGVMRRNHLHVSLLWFCCLTGFSFLEEHLLILQQSFCYYFHFFSMDMVLYLNMCKYWYLWRYEILCSYISVWKPYLGSCNFLKDPITLFSFSFFPHINIYFLFLLQYWGESYSEFSKGMTHF